LSERLKSFGFTLGPITITFDTQSAGDGRLYITNHLPEDFQKLAEELTNITNTKGILLMLDDADEISAAIFETFRIVFPDSGLYTLFIVSGRRLFMTGETLTLDEYNMRLLRPFSNLRIKPLDLHQIKELLLRPLSKTGGSWWYDDKHIEIIARMARGNPYIAYSIGELCFDHGLNGHQVRLTKHVADLARESLWGVEQNVIADQNLIELLNRELDRR
jgi:hypothetical protein